jgi:hypothetical protein
VVAATVQIQQLLVILQVNTEEQLSSTIPVHFHIKVWKGLVSVNRQFARVTTRWPNIGLPHHCGELQKRIATQLIHSQLKIIEPSNIGLPHHCGELQKRIATQLIHSQLKIIEPSMDLRLHFL